MSYENSKPLVSIIVPIHNRSDLLRRALRSLTQQSIQDFEVIVIDDGSTENIQTVVNEFDDRFRHIRLGTNRGASKARNVGVAQSAGDYVAFLDSDDEWMPSKLQHQIDALRNSAFSNVGAVYCGKEVVYGLGRTARFPAVCRGDIFWHLLGFDDDIRLTSSSILVTREVVDSGTRFDEDLPSFQDWDFLTQVSRRFAVEAVRESLVLQHLDHQEEHVWRSSTVPVGLALVMSKYASDFKQRPTWHARVLFRAALARHLNGDVRGLRRLLLESYRVDPGDLRIALWLLGALVGGSMGFRVALRLVNRRSRPRTCSSCRSAVN